MSENKQVFCPITQKKCREDCSWYHSFINVDENGADKEDYCAVSVIANALCDLGEPVDWDAW